VTWNKLEIERELGDQPNEESFVRQVNAITAECFGCEVPLQETYDHLTEANLGHYIFVEESGEKKLVGYALNDLFEVEVNGKSYRANYFSSAFILPHYRRNFMLYKMLGTARLIQDEDLIMVRTQNPIVMSFFAWLCEFFRMRMVTHLESKVQPALVRKALQQKFGNTELFCPGVYGRCLTGAPVEPKTKFSTELMRELDPDQGDALILVGIR